MGSYMKSPLLTIQEGISILFCFILFYLFPWKFNYLADKA